MTSFGFKDRNVADRLKQFANTLGPLDGPPDVRHTGLYYFKAPVGGIPAKSGTTWGKATCTLYHIDYDGTDCDEAVAQDTSSTDITTTVFNWTQSDIAGDAFLWAMIAYGVMVIVNVDCG